MTQTYTITRNGTVAEEASLQEAAAAILEYDGGDYQIRPLEEGGFSLWIKSLSEKDLHESVLFSMETDRRTAEVDIFKQVLTREEWSEFSVYTTEEWQKAMAEGE